jgi:hypothetical protein
MIAHMSHAHPLFKVDNGAVFELIKNAVRGTAIAALIVPFQRECNPCVVWQAMQLPLTVTTTTPPCKGNPTNCSYTPPRPAQRWSRTGASGSDRCVVYEPSH